MLYYIRTHLYNIIYTECMHNTPNVPERHNDRSFLSTVFRCGKRLFVGKKKPHLIRLVLYTYYNAIASEAALALVPLNTKYCHCVGQTYTI